MKIKKVIIGILLGLVIVAVAIVGYEMLTTKSHSPADELVYQDNNFTLTVNYSRPYKKGRLIFGKEQEGALVPFDTYWRTGANEATEIEFSHDVEIEGKAIEAGTYRLYTIPGKNEWIVALNSDIGEWGYYEPEQNMDVLRVRVQPGQSESFFEQFTISSEKLTESSVILSLQWDKTVVPVRIDY